MTGPRATAMGLRDRPGILVGAVARACLLHLERQGRGEEVASVLAPLLDHEFVEREFPTRGGVPLDDETLSSISFRFDPYHHPDPDRHRHTTPPPVLTVSASVARGIVIGDIMLWIGNGALPKTVVTDLFARAENGTLVLGDVVRTGDPTLDPLPLRFPVTRRLSDRVISSTQFRTIQTPTLLADVAAEMERIAG